MTDTPDDKHDKHVEPDDLTLGDMLFAQLREHNPAPEGNAPGTVLRRVDHHMRATAATGGVGASIVHLAERTQNNVAKRRWPVFLAGAASAAAVFAIFSLTDAVQLFGDQGSAADAVYITSEAATDPSAGAAESAAEGSMEESATDAEATVTAQDDQAGATQEADETGQAGHSPIAGLPHPPRVSALPGIAQFAYEFDVSKLSASASQTATSTSAHAWVFNPAAVFSESQVRSLASSLGLEARPTQVNNLQIRHSTTGTHDPEVRGSLLLDHTGMITYTASSGERSQNLTSAEQKEFTEAFAGVLDTLGWPQTQVRLHQVAGVAGTYDIQLTVADRVLEREITATFAAGQLTSLHGQFFAAVTSADPTEIISPEQAAKRLGDTRYLTNAFLSSDAPTPAELQATETGTQNDSDTSGVSVPRVRYELTGVRASYLPYGQLLLPAYTFTTAQGVAWQVVAVD